MMPSAILEIKVFLHPKEWPNTLKKLALREIKNAPSHTAARLRDLLLYEKWQWS